MTTTVTVHAHCDKKTTKVRISQVYRGPAMSEHKEPEFMNDGDTKDFTVYDNYYLMVSEVPIISNTGGDGPGKGN